MKPSANTHLSLIDCLQTGNPEAWSRFDEFYGPYVEYWASRLGVGQNDVADIRQETGHVVYKRIKDFVHAGHCGCFRSWVRQITANVVREKYRADARNGFAQGVGGTDAQIRWQETLDPNSEDSDPPEVVVQLYRRVLEYARENVSDQQWTVLVMLEVEHKTVEEVAQFLGISKELFRQDKHRILKRLRTELGEFSG